MSEWKAWQEAKYHEGISGDLAGDKENEESVSGASSFTSTGIHARDEKGSTLIEVTVWAQNLDLGRSLSRMSVTMANIDSAAIAASIVMPMLLS
ncbi:hypothetical protein CEP52_015517 [Fusarium oligoseptatum]|uniref:Uncharacterized protein n=1 Tax=Fusarium oligoseptatum TaxID=2604345 RepID=A0A428SCE6_9HYPO|nr:hypothetical protein CEP52_015517 [Fusarium oligoseptatum]